MDGPSSGEKKVAGDPLRSSAERMAMQRRAEDSTEEQEADPSEALARSILFENCKAIFNSQNWDCTEQTEHATGALINIKQMNDGIYTASLTNYRNMNGVMNVTRELAICAK